MKCLSCGKPVTTREARLWERKLLVCLTCGELGDKALAEIKIALARAEQQAMMFLEQRIMSGGLLEPGTGMDLPNVGIADRDLQTANVLPGGQHG